MARTDNFRPYADNPPERERIQRLESLFIWMYREYANKDAFDYDFFGVLGSLDMGSGTTWSSDQLTSFLTAQDLSGRQELQQRVKGLVDRGLASLRKPKTYFLLAPSVGPPYRTFMVSYEETDGVFLRRGYFFNEKEPPTLERLSDILWLRVVDVLLQGINLDAIVACAECGHFTARSHPRGKLYCSPDCRVRASLRTRRETVRAAQTQRKRKSTRKEK
jgi:hypothetical protein